MNAGAYPTYGDPALAPQHPDLGNDDGPDHRLEIRQQPQHARVAIGKEKDRKPVDPPPILQLKVSPKKDPQQHFLQSPYFFMSCALISADPNVEDPAPNNLLGTVVSSLHRLKDTDNHDGGFFVFGDLSVKVEGKFRLLFTLFQIKSTECVKLTATTSETFEVHATKKFPGLAESTFLTRSFSDQGVRLRLRKDSRSMTTRKRNASMAEFARTNSVHDKMDRQQKMPGRAGSGDDGGVPQHHGPLGGVYDPSPNYGYDLDGMSKRRRMMPDEGSPVYERSPVYAHDAGPHSYTHGVVGYSPRPQQYHPPIPHPVSTATYSVPHAATTAPYSAPYQIHAPPTPASATMYFPNRPIHDFQ